MNPIPAASYGLDLFREICRPQIGVNGNTVAELPIACAIRQPACALCGLLLVVLSFSSPTVRIGTAALWAADPKSVVACFVIDATSSLSAVTLRATISKLAVVSFVIDAMPLLSAVTSSVARRHTPASQSCWIWRISAGLWHATICSIASCIAATPSCRRCSQACVNASTLASDLACMVNHRSTFWAKISPRESLNGDSDDDWSCLDSDIGASSVEEL